MEFTTCPNCLGDLIKKKWEAWEYEWDDGGGPGEHCYDYGCTRCGRSFSIEDNGDWRSRNSAQGETYSAQFVRSIQKS